MVVTGKVKTDGVKMDNQGVPISPGFYVAADQRDCLGSRLIRVCKAGDDLLFDKMDGHFGVLSECDDDCLKRWTRVVVMPGLGSGLNFF